MTQGTSQDTESDHGGLPRHIAVIMDGNGRWAQRRGLPRYAGHPVGVDAVRRIVEACVERGIEVLTLFAFSSENWQRPQKEVSLIMDLFIRSLKKEARRLHRNGVRLRIIGDRAAFSDKLRQHINEVESLTEANAGMVLQVAANYGGRWDIANAARRLAERVQSGELQAEQVDESVLAGGLSFPQLPEPDLFIRTGGERRLSNFLLWQCAYTELYFTDILWPDFDKAALDEALQDYANRQRRFGRTSEQITNRVEAS
jgi:undecaprenyl diphosphate synthase